MNRARFFAAFMVAPVTPAFIVVVPALLMGAPLPSAWTMFALVGLVTYAHAIALGLPAVWLLSRGSSLTLLRAVGAAFVIGVLPLGGLVLYQELTMPPGAGYEANGVVLRDDGRLTGAGLWSAVSGVLQGGALGTVTGLVWWLIAMPQARKRST